MATTCEACGFLETSDVAAACPICGRPFHARRQPPPPPPGREAFSAGTAAVDVGFGIAAPPVITGDICGHRPSPPAVAGTAAEQPFTEGVIHGVARYDERTPFNVCRFLARALTLLMLAPLYLILFLVSLVLFIALAIVGFSTLASIFNPLHWTGLMLEALEVIVLRNHATARTVPLYRGTLRDDENRLTAFFMYGPLRTGDLIQGHRVRLYGTRRREGRPADDRGTLAVRRGHDLETGATISSAYTNPWRIVLPILVVLLGAELWALWYWGDALYRRLPL